jgi:hypothetical protein
MTPRFDNFELRLTTAGLYDAFLRQTKGSSSFITPALKQTAAMSPGRDLKIPVINYKDVTVRSTRPLTIVADENTSALYTVVWNTYAYGFKMYRAQHKNNDVSYQLDWNKKYLAMIKKMRSTIEAAAYTAIDAAKTQVLPTVVGGHTFATSLLSETGIATLNDSYILNDLDPSMNTNDFDFFGGDIVGNQGLNAILSRMAGFSKFNSENKTLPYQDKFMHFSNSIPDAGAAKATGFGIADGHLGLLTRVEPDSEMRTKLKTGHEWDKVNVPLLGIEMGSYTYEEAVDASGLGAHATHLTRTGAEVFDFAVDMAFVIAYNSDRTTIPSGILKFDIATV